MQVMQRSGVPEHLLAPPGGEGENVTKHFTYVEKKILAR